LGFGVVFLLAVLLTGASRWFAAAVPSAATREGNMKTKFASVKLVSGAVLEVLGRIGTSVSVTALLP
jgi:hypothetical protein